MGQPDEQSLHHAARSVPRWGYWLAAAITLALVALAFTQISFGDVSHTLRRTQAGWLAAAVVAYVASGVLRAYRFRLMGLGRIPAGVLVANSFLYYFFCGLLPMRAGEVSLPLLLRRYRGATTAEALAALVLARVCDMVMILLLWIFTALALAPTLWESQRESTIRVAIVAVAVCLACLAAINRLPLLLKLMRSPGERLSARRGIAHSAGRMLTEVADAFQRLHDSRLLAKAMGLSLLAWICLFAVSVSLLYALGEETGLGPAVLASCFAVAAGLLPLGTFANFGPVEAGWTLGLGVIGYSLPDALAVSVALHVLMLIIQTVVSLAAWVALWKTE